MTSYIWDSVGNLVSVENTGGTTSYGYDTLNLVSGVGEDGERARKLRVQLHDDPPAGEPERDAALVKSVLDQEGSTTSYGYEPDQGFLRRGGGPPTNFYDAWVNLYGAARGLYFSS